MKTSATRRRVFTVLAVLAVAAIGFAGCDKIETLMHGDRCVLSDRVIHPRMAATIAVQDGPSGRTCCIRCAITYAQQTGKDVRVVSVTDYLTHKQLAPDKASYVTGSDVAPCVGPRVKATGSRRECCFLGWDRCSPSTVAFANIQEAQRFQREHGGRIETFADLARPTHGRLTIAPDG